MAYISFSLCNNGNSHLFRMWEADDHAYQINIFYYFYWQSREGLSETEYCKCCLINEDCVQDPLAYAFSPLAYVRNENSHFLRMWETDDHAYHINKCDGQPQTKPELHRINKARAGGGGGGGGTGRGEISRKLALFWGLTLILHRGITNWTEMSNEPSLELLGKTLNEEV